MHERPKAIQRILLSPATSILMAIIALGLMSAWVGCSWIVTLLSLIIAALMTSQIKARALYNGVYYPYLGIFLLLQAAMPPSIEGIVLTLVAIVVITTLLICFNVPSATRALFLIFLACGTGALFNRSYALLAGIFLVATILVRAFSARGLVASLLGFITPAIITLPTKIVNYQIVLSAYNKYFAPGYDTELIIIAFAALIAGSITFLPSYGYPARSRARNMTILGITIGAAILPFIDFANAENYYGLLNLCVAYNICHMASLKHSGWIYIVLTWGILLGMILTI